MDKLHFPAREVPPYGEYATADTLLEGHTYFRLGYVDKQMRIPELTPLVYLGRNLAENDTDALYFQDAASYLAGIRFGDGNEGDYHTVDAATPFVYDFERALDRLLCCSLTRRRER
jgi:hypothetical protein